MQFWSTKIAVWKVCSFGSLKLYEGLQFLPKKLHLGDNTSCLVFVDVGLEVLNHIKFPICFYLFFCSYLWVCFCLKRLLFLVHDFPTLVSKLRFWPRVSNQGRKRSNLAYWPESTSFEESGVRVWQDAPGYVREVVKFVCGKMLPDFQRRLLLVLTWPVSDVRCESWFVVCAWRNCSTVYRSTLVVASSGLRCLVMLDLHGEGGARDIQWWYFAWLTRCFVNNGYCHCVVAVSWLDQGGVMMDSPWVLVNC